MGSPLGFGQVSSPPATSAFSFATKPAGAAVTAPAINWGTSGGSLAFGQTPAPNVTAPQISTFGASSSAPLGFSFGAGGQTATSVPTSTLNFGQPAQANPAPITFGQVAQPNASVAPISFGQPAQPNPAPLSFGQATQPNPAPITFGQATQQNPAPISFGQPAPAVASPALSFGLPAASTAAPALNFGSSPVSSVLSFGQPTVSTAAPSKGFPLTGVQQQTPATIGLNLVI